MLQRKNEGGEIRPSEPQNWLDCSWMWGLYARECGAYIKKCIPKQTNASKTYSIGLSVMFFVKIWHTVENIVENIEEIIDKL